MTAGTYHEGQNPLKVCTVDASDNVTPSVNVVGATINVTGFAGYPIGAVSLNAASGNKAAATAAATLAHDGALTCYISGFELTGAGATSASVVLLTVTGILGGTLTYVVAVPAGVTAALSPLIVEFPVPLPAVDANTDIVVTVPTFGSGNTNAAVVAHGYKV